MARIITPATEPLNSNNGREQMENHTGGFVYRVDDLIRLTRLFCLGSESGTYYVGDEEINTENVQCITRLVAAGRGQEVVRMLIEYNENNRTAKQNALMLAMAICARQSVDPDTKKLCYENLHNVCRIPTQLFMFIKYCKAVSEPRKGWGRAHRRAICSWYFRFGENPAMAKQLAVLITKYKNSHGWSHKDVMCLAHPKPNSEINYNGVTAIMRYIMRGFHDAEEDLGHSSGPLLEYLRAVEYVKTQTDPNNVVDMIRRHHLVREHINTQLLDSAAVWEALLENMPMTAMIRNLGKMSSVGMLTPGSRHENTITSMLGNLNMLKKARIHPFGLLIALLTYKTGKGQKGRLSWTPNKAVLEALDSAFYLTFRLVMPTDERYLLAVNVSASMYHGQVIGCSNITPASAAAALSLVTARRERQCEIIAFSDDFVEVKIGPHMDLSAVETVMKGVQSGTTGADCSLPMQYALKHKKMFDVFVVYTDHETNTGYIHAVEQLSTYRRWSGIHDAKLIMCAMSVNDFSISDRDDRYVMHMPGFDTDAPEAMRQFIVKCREWAAGSAADARHISGQ